MNAIVFAGWLILTAIGIIAAICAFNLRPPYSWILAGLSGVSVIMGITLLAAGVIGVSENPRRFYAQDVYAIGMLLHGKAVPLHVFERVKSDMRNEDFERETGISSATLTNLSENWRYTVVFRTNAPAPATKIWIHTKRH